MRGTPSSVASERTAAGTGARSSWRSWRFAGALAVSVLIAAVYADVRHFSFLQFDDADYVTENAAVRAGLGWAGVRWAFTTTHAGNWHPVTWLSHMLDVQLFGLDAGWHHLVSAVIHLLNTLLLFGLLQRLTRQTGPSLFVAAAFGLHPLHVESVAWVAERKDVLSTLWWLLALGAYVRYTERPTRGFYAAALAFFALALLCKPMVVTLPVVLLLLDFWPLGRFGARADRGQTADRRRGLRAGALLREKVPFVALAAAASIATIVAQSRAGAVQSAEAFPWALRLANVPLAYVNYLWRAIWPADLAVLYPYPDAIPIWAAALSLMLLIAVTWIATKRARAQPYLVAGWLWFLVTLLPVIGIIQVGSQPFADRYTYVPAVGLFIMFAWGMRDLAGGSVVTARLAGLAGTCAIGALAAVTTGQIAVWRDSLTLWEHAIEATDRNYRAHTNLGFALAEAGLPGRAVTEYREAIRIEPAYANAHNYLGALLTEQGDPARAVPELRQALSTRPRFVEAHNNLGLAFAALGQPGDAIGAFREAVRLNPAFAPGWNNLGIALAGAGQIDAAIGAFEQSVRFQPESAQAHFNLGTALAEAGRASEARLAFEASLRIDPSFTAAREAIGRGR